MIGSMLKFVAFASSGRNPSTCYEKFRKKAVNRGTLKDVGEKVDVSVKIIGDIHPAHLNRWQLKDDGSKKRPRMNG